MSKLGGYQIIDFKGIALTSGTEKTILGVYDAIERTNKRTVVSGLVVGSTEYNDMEVNFVVSGTSFVGVVTLPSSGSISFVVADDDGVTVTVA